MTSVYTSSSSESRNDVIYMSTLKNSYPYKVYTNMRQEFWTHEFHMKVNKSKPKRPLPKIISETDTRVYSSALETTNGMDNISNSTVTLNENKMKVQKLHPVDLVNTSENNEKPFQNMNVKLPSNDIPMNVDMSTQFNSDMKIIVEQDSKDKNIINIRFGGPFTGFIEGTGTMSHSKFLSLINESVMDNIKDTKVKPQMEVKPLEQPAQVMKSKMSTSKSQTSLPSEESLNYFASTKPLKPLVTDSVSNPDYTVPLNVTKTSSVSNILRSEKTLGTVGRYEEPFTPNNGTSWLPSISANSTNKVFDTIPAVIPRCIINRIVKAMITDLDIPIRGVHKPNNLELKVTKLTTNTEILSCNWHAAIIKARIMIGELIELILSVNVDNVTSSPGGIDPVLMELKIEFVDCCVYLSRITEASKVKDQICLELLIDLMLEEIRRLPGLYADWLKSNRQETFSTFFINDLTKDISSTYSEDVSRSESNTIVKENQRSVSQSSLDSQPNTSTQSASRQKRRQKMNDTKPESTFSEKPTTVTQQKMYTDPSIITNSRVKKTMNTILQLAIKQNLGTQTISKESRNQIIPIDFIDSQPIVTRNREESLIKRLVHQTEMWNIPIKAGENSIEDLVEFIINTISQDRETTKQLYTEIESELKTLEEELITSVAKNLHDSRLSNEDLVSLCYEILVEIIFKSLAMAKYLFHSLETTEVDSAMLGKLFRNYILENVDADEKDTVNKGSEKYAHLTSEIKNYDDMPGNITLTTQRPLPENSIAKSGPEHPTNLQKQKSSETSMLRNSSSKQFLETGDPVEKDSKLRFLNSDQYVLTQQETQSRLNSSDLNVPSSPESKSSKVPKHQQHVAKVKSKSENGPGRKGPEIPNSQKKTDSNTNKTRGTDPSMFTEHDSLVQKDSSEKSANKKTDSSTQMMTSDYQNQDVLDPARKQVKINNSNDKVGRDMTTWPDDNKQLLIIFNKLMSQTMEIDRIKETLRTLSISVNEKLANWTCKMPLAEEELDSGDQNFVINFAKSTNLFNIQEIVEPPKDLLVSIQPKEHPFTSESNLMAVRDEKKSFIAPISNEMSEQKIKTPKEQPSNVQGNIIDLDIMKLIVDGSHNLLTSKQIRKNQIPQLERQDSCQPINTEFDKIFQWIIERYEDTLEGMKANNASKKIVEALNTSSFEEKRAIEKELIKRIVDQNNLTIHNWVKDICFRKVLKCLT